jgi:hypothetical protein
MPRRPRGPDGCTAAGHSTLRRGLAARHLRPFAADAKNDFTYSFALFGPPALPDVVTP